MVSPEKWDEWFKRVTDEYPAFRWEDLPEKLINVTRWNATLVDTMGSDRPAGFTFADSAARLPGCCGVIEWYVVEGKLDQLTVRSVAVLGMMIHRPRPNWQMQPSGIVCTTRKTMYEASTSKPTKLDAVLLELGFTPVFTRKNGNTGNMVTLWSLGLGEEGVNPSIQAITPPVIDSPVVVVPVKRRRNAIKAS